MSALCSGSPCGSVRGPQFDAFPRGLPDRGRRSGVTFSSLKGTAGARVVNRVMAVLLAYGTVHCRVSVCAVRVPTFTAHTRKGAMFYHVTRDATRPGIPWILRCFKNFRGIYQNLIRLVHTCADDTQKCVLCRWPRIKPSLYCVQPPMRSALITEISNLPTTNFLEDNLNFYCL